MLSRRAVLTAGLGLAAYGAAARAAAAFDGVVGQGGHATVEAAIKAAPVDLNRPHRILIGKGRWHEKLTIDRPWIRLIGEDRSGSILDFNAAAGQRAPDGRPWGTSRTASLTIEAADCGLANLTVANSFDYPLARRDPKSTDAGDGLQAVALSIARAADRTVIEHVDMTGYQDTLLVNAGRSLFSGCTIAGAVDFIFGGGTAYFERCRIVCRGRTEMTTRRQGYITAPSTKAANPYGLVFDRCRLDKEPQVKAGVFALGRPWRAGQPDTVGQAVFLRCWMDDHIDPVGWDRMSYGRDAAGELLWFNPEQARFFEFESRGPGAAVNAQRRQLTDAQARFFARDRVLGDWRPSDQR